MEWLTGPVIVRRYQAFAVALVVGTLIASAMIVSHNAQTKAAGVDQGRRADLRAQLRREIAAKARERLTAAEVRGLARRAARLERPSTNDLLRALRRLSRLCARDAASCRRAVTTGAREGAQAPDGSQVPGRPSGQAGAPTAPQRRRGPSTRPDRQRPSGGGSSSPPPAGPSGSPAGPPSPPPPVVTVTLPSLPGVPCPAITTPLAGVNCGG